MTHFPDPYLRLRPQIATAADEICRCGQETPVLLQPHLSRNPLSCARCNLEVPPERLGFDVALADALASWRAFHDSFYYLWLDSGEFENWAAAQLRDPSSPVNVRGLDLAHRLSMYCSCYLWWFQDEGAPDWMPATRCPRCSATLDVKFRGQRPQGGELRVCGSCLIALSA
jgi:hypothetical protein